MKKYVYACILVCICFSCGSKHQSQQVLDSDVLWVVQDTIQEKTDIYARPNTTINITYYYDMPR